MTDAPRGNGVAAPLRVAIRTLGCKVNQVESERIARELLGLGATVVPEDRAEVVVVNSCTVTAEADAKVRKAVRHALSGPSEPVVVVTGCLASTDPAALRGLGARVVVESDKEAVAARVAETLGRGRPAAVPDAGRNETFRTRAMVKVQEGCDSRCSYCIVPDARGGPRSEPRERVLAEVERLVASGVQEVVLTGTNIGRYDGLGGLPSLIADVASSGVRRVRLSSIEPLDVSDEFLEAVSCIAAFVPHLHVPLQSGADAVLGAMGRGYDTRTYAARIEAARSAIRGLALTTDVLAGFPAETPEDARSTLAFCEDVGFQRLHVFRYSVRPGTPAAELPERVPAEEIAARAAALRDLSDRLSERYRSARLGGRANVLVERVDGAWSSGTSEDYVRVRFTGGLRRVGEVVEVLLTGLDGSGMTGESCGPEC